MKNLFLLLAILITTAAIAQKQMPPEKGMLTPANNKLIFTNDTTNIEVWQIILKNDTASRTDSAKFYEIVDNTDTLILRFKNAKTGVEDTIVNKSGYAQDYILTKPIVGKLMVKLLSITTVDVYLRKRKYH